MSETNVDETNATPTAIRATSNGRAVVWKQSLAWEMKILPVPLFSDYTGSKLSETAELDTFDRDTGLDLEGNHLESIPYWVKSFTNVAPVISPADAQASEKLYQLAEIIGVSRTLPGTVGLSWALVVDAAP